MLKISTSHLYRLKTFTNTTQNLGAYINGQHYLPQDTKSQFINYNPAKKDAINNSCLPLSTTDEFNRLIDTSMEGQQVWAKMPGVERGRILRRAVDLIRENLGEIAKAETLDTGKPIIESVNVDVVTAIDTLEYYANLAATDCVEGVQVPIGNAGSFGYTRREPLGVCFGIGAWNYPFQIATWKSAPALACGNSMIYKPASITPTSAFMLAELYSAAGVPDGVFNVMLGREGAEYLLRDPRVAKVSLTGEVGTGKKISATASSTLKKVTMELGGKSPLVIMPDAVDNDSSLANVVNGICAANFYTAGEVCSNGTRVFIHEDIHDKVVDALVQKIQKSIRIGDPLDENTNFGALISHDHLKNVLAYVNKGIEEGANMVIGKNQPEEISGGAFLSPVVFTNVNDNMTIAREEIFGPVVSILKFTSLDEVIQRANNCEYGLGAGIFTKDLMIGHEFANKIQSGSVWINNFNLTPAEIPFGGYKSSGIGRENSKYAIESYTQIKSIYVEMDHVEDGFM